MDDDADNEGEPANGDDGEQGDFDDGPVRGVTWREYDQARLFAAINALPDAMLQSLVLVANKEMVTFGVTVFAHGFAVSGLVVGVSQWLNDWSTHVEATSQDGWMLTTFYREMALAHTVDSALEDADDDPPPTPAPIYLHLENATVFQGGVVLAVGQFLRLRLSEVSSWTLAPLPSSA